jgi:3-hydroxyacyl-[acyl-carrier-protein] dehydratase
LTEVAKAETEVSLQELMELMPYGQNFLFVDEFLEADSSHIVTRYCFRKDHAFFADHFPGRAVTPGVIQLEAMCQCGMVAQGLYLLAVETGLENARRYRFLFTNSEVEWLQPVYPGDTVVIRSELLAWRLRRVRASVQMFSEAGILLSKSVVCGTGVLWNSGTKSPGSTVNGTERSLSKTKQGACNES